VIAARLLAIAAGAVIVGLLGYWGIGLAGQWFELHLARGESDLSRAFVVMLALLAACLIGGGWLGNSLYRRYRSPSAR